MNPPENPQPLGSSPTKKPPIAAANIASIAQVKPTAMIREAIPWWMYFTAGALAGWLAKGRVTWIAGAAAAVYYLNQAKKKKAQAANQAAMNKSKALTKAKAAISAKKPEATATPEHSFENLQGGAE